MKVWFWILVGLAIFSIGLLGWNIYIGMYENAIANALCVGSFGLQTLYVYAIIHNDWKEIK